MLEIEKFQEKFNSGNSFESFFFEILKAQVFCILVYFPFVSDL